jgi:hypothetical protein
MAGESARPVRSESDCSSRGQHDGLHARVRPGYALGVSDHNASPDEPSIPSEVVSPSTRRRRPSLQLIVALALFSVILVVGTLGILIYDRATAIDRSTPTVVVGQFLVASFHDRDPKRVAFFICEQLQPDEALADTIGGIDTNVAVSWGDYSTDQGGNSATVIAQMAFRVDQGANSYSTVEQWRFSLVKQDGWRVCGIHRPS